MYTLMSDPGHSWLSVPLKEIVELGIADQISSYSYMNATRAFLEEDSDLGIFMEAKGLTKADIKSSYSEHYTIRSLALFNADHLKQKLEVGTRVVLHNELCVTITSIVKNGFILCNGNRLPKSNPFRYIKSVLEN